MSSFVLSLTRGAIACALVAGFWAGAAHAQVTRATDWIGQVVVTEGGELLGRVEDFALTEQARGVEYVVVSVGSFLIDDNLIAVEPGALKRSEDGRYWVIESETLAGAPRFNAQTWPGGAQVFPRPPAPEAAGEPGAAPGAGHATISGAGRRAIIKSGERASTIESAPETLPATPRKDQEASVALRPKVYRQGVRESNQSDEAFVRLDDDGDGYLSRREIGPAMDRNTRFSDFDLDANGGLDLFEFRVWQDRSG